MLEAIEQRREALLELACDLTASDRRSRQRRLCAARDVDFVLGSALGVVGLAGVLAGARMAHALPAERLRRVIGLLLVLFGAGILARTFW